MDEIHIDYGKEGEKCYIIENLFFGLTNTTLPDLYTILFGKYKYKIVIGEFVDYDDFIKLRSSTIIECRVNNMKLKDQPENRGEIFLKLACSDIVARLKDCFGIIEDISPKKSSKNVHRIG